MNGPNLEIIKQWSTQDGEVEHASIYKTLQNFLPRSEAFLIHLHDAAIALVTHCCMQTLMIMAFLVDPTRRRQGYGTRLLKEIEHLCKSNYLITVVCKNRAFWYKMGFVDFDAENASMHIGLEAFAIEAVWKRYKTNDTHLLIKGISK